MSQLRVRPKLVVEGADRAIEFYESVLGASLTSRYVMGGTVVFAQLDLPSGDVIQLKDPDDVDRSPADGGCGLVMDIMCADPDALVAAAVERGAAMIFDVDDQPYGARQGRFRDPFGHQWIAGTALTKTDEEIQRALEVWATDGGQQP